MPEREHDEDALLVTRARQGDWMAFTRLMERYRRMVCAIIRTHAGQDVVDDLYQDVLVRAWSRLSGLRDPRAFPSWINRLAVNMARHWRDRAARKDQSFDALPVEIPAPRSNPLDIVLQHEQSCLLRDALLSLPEDNRHAFIMSQWGQYSYTEIAERFDVPVSTVVGRIQRARQKLLRAFGVSASGQQEDIPMRGTVHTAADVTLLPQFGFSSPVLFLALSQDNRVLVTGEDCGRLIAWDTATRLQRWQKTLSGSIFSVCMSADGCMVACSYFERAETSVWDMERGVEVAVLPIRMHTASFSGDNKMLMTGSWTPMPEDESWYRTNLFCWSLKTGKVIHRYENLPGGPILVQADAMRGITLTGDRIFEGDKFQRLENPGLLLWDMQSGAELHRLPGLHGYPDGQAMSRDGRYFAVLTRQEGIGQTLLAWDIDSGQLLHSTPLESHPVYGSLKFTADNRQLCCAAHDGTIYRWEVTSGRLLHRAQTGENTDHLVFSDDGHQAYLSHIGDFWQPTLLKHWQEEDGAPTAFAVSHMSRIAAIACSDDGSLLVSAPAGSPLLCWTLPEVAITPLSLPERSVCFSLTLHPSGEILLAAVNAHPAPGVVQVWDIGQPRLLKTLEDHNGPVMQVAFTPDGTYALSYSRDGSIIVRESVGWGIVRRFEHGSEWTRSFGMAISPDSQRMAATAIRIDTTNTIIGGTLSLWQLNNGELLQQWHHPRGFDAVAFSPDGRRIAVSLADEGQYWKSLCPLEVLVFDTATGELLQQLRVPHSTGWVSRLVYHPSGEYLAACTLSGHLIMWETAGGNPIVNKRLPGYLYDMAVFPDWSRMVVASSDGTLHLLHTDQLSSGKVTEAGSLISLDQGTAWFAQSPAGYFDGSQGIDECVRWRIAEKVDDDPHFTKRFHRHHLVQQILTRPHT